MLISFVVTIYVVRYLGPENFGIISYAMSFAALFSAFAILGLESIIIRELVKFPEKRDELLGTGFWLRTIGAVVSIIVIITTLLIIKEKFSLSLFILIAAASHFFQSFQIIDYFFRAKVQAKYSVYAQFTAMFLSSVFKVVLILTSAPLIYFVIAFSVEFVFAAAGFVLAYKTNKLSIFNWHFSKMLAKELMKDSWPLILSGIMVSLYMRIDQVMLKYMMDEKSVGYYAAAVRLSEAWYFIPVAICNSLFPAIVNAKKVNEVFYQNRMQKLYDLLAFIAIMIALPVTFFSNQIITILYGNEFISSAPVLTIYIWAGVAVFLGVASSQYLINENLTKFSFFRTALGTVSNVILNFILIPLYGITGSALATLISYSVATFSIGFSKRTYKQTWMMIKSIFFFSYINFGMKKWLSR
jgi:O-antigen/teichoic acid export membrane protein